MPGRVRTEIHLSGVQTGGAFCMLVDHPPAGWSLPPHLHRNEAETIHVVEGSFEMVVEGSESVLGPGDTAHVPLGVLHGGRNIGDAPGQRIVIFSPAGMEDFFSELGTTSPSDEVDPHAALETASRYGWRFGSAPG